MADSSFSASPTPPSPQPPPPALHDYIGLSHHHQAPSSPRLPPPPPRSPSPHLSLDLALALSFSPSSPKDSSNHPPIPPSQLRPLPDFLALSAQKNASAKRGYSDTLSHPSSATTTDARFHPDIAPPRDADSNLETKPAALPRPPPPPPPPSQQQQQQPPPPPPPQQQQKQQQPSFLPTWAPAKPTVPSWHAVSMEKPCRPPFKPDNSSADASADVPPPPKDRVVGWPPVRSYRRQTLAKPAEMFVKVNMDGIAVGRKVDLQSYSSYEGLLRALQDMFQPSNTGAVQGACPAAPPGRDKSLLLSPGSEFVLTYEDKDGDWMLVGDVPWSMFISTVKRLRITRRSESTAPVSRGTEKSRFAM